MTLISGSVLPARLFQYCWPGRLASSEFSHALRLGTETEYTQELRKKRGLDTYPLLYARNLSAEQIKEYNDNRPTENNTEVDMIIDFYNRFLYRMEYMIRVGKEKGYDLISFMGP